jgi:hypothetical protein
LKLEIPIFLRIEKLERVSGLLIDRLVIVVSAPFVDFCLPYSEFMVRTSWGPAERCLMVDDRFLGEALRDFLEFANERFMVSEHGEWDPRDVAEGVVMKVRGGEKGGKDGKSEKEYDVRLSHHNSSLLPNLIV